MSDATTGSISSFVVEQRELLALELQADEEQDGDSEERTSHLLGNLEASDVSVGLYGRTVVRLNLWSEKPGNLLPAHRLTVGDEVEIRSKQKPKHGFPGGVISEVSDTHVAVALFSKTSSDNKKSSNGHDDNDNDNDNDSEDGFGSPPLTLVPRSSIDVHRKLLSALFDLEKQGVNHPVAGPVIHAMFHPLDVPPPPSVTHNWQPFNSGLDDSQQEAIAFALQPDRPIALIHGPPGTGKACVLYNQNVPLPPPLDSSLAYSHISHLFYISDHHCDRAHSTSCSCSQTQSFGYRSIQCCRGQRLGTTRSFIYNSYYQKGTQASTITKDTIGTLRTSSTSQIFYFVLQFRSVGSKCRWDGNRRRCPSRTSIVSSHFV